MSSFAVYLPIAKVDEERRIVSGYASTEAKDSDGEIIALDAVKAAMPDYLEYGNIREMHKLNAVGVAAEHNFDKKGLYLSAYIADDAAWKKCLPQKMPDGTVLPPVYKGFSIGGRKLAKKGNKITELELNEISVVDRPSNPDCKIDIAKSEQDAEEDDAEGYLVKAMAEPPAAKDGFSLPAKTKKADELGSGNANDPKAKKPDTEGLPAKHPDKDVSVKDKGSSQKDTAKADDMEMCEKHKKVGCMKCAIQKRMDEACEKHGKVACVKCMAKLMKRKADDGKSKEPYGNVEYADPGHQADGKKRYPIDTEEHVRAAWNYINKPKNAAKYGEHAASVKSKIVSAWKKKIHPDGPPGAAAEKAVVAEPLSESVFDLRKGMSTVSSLAYAFDSIRGAQREALREGKAEGGDKADFSLAGKLGSIAKDLAGVMSLKASHEGEEAIDLSDADDTYIRNIMGMDKMSDNDMRYAAGGDPLSAAILDLVKRAAAPTKAQMMEKAEEECKKSRKAAKSAKAELEDCSKMIKAHYLAKMEKAKKGEKDGGDDFDHEAVMGKLQKAYAEMDKVRTFGKSAMNSIAKARAGQRGQETGDAEGDYYRVPPGVKDMSKEQMARLGPSASGPKGSNPITMMDNTADKADGAGDLRKYAHNGMVPVDLAEMLAKNMALEARLEAVGTIPGTAVGGRRPFAFNPADLHKAAGGNSLVTAGRGAQNPQEVIFKGVNVNDIGSGDEMRHTQAAAKAIGNFLLAGEGGTFGKSVFSEDFKGTVGATK